MAPAARELGPAELKDPLTIQLPAGMMSRTNKHRDANTPLPRDMDLLKRLFTEHDEAVIALVLLLQDKTDRERRLTNKERDLKRFGPPMTEQEYGNSLDKVVVSLRIEIDGLNQKLEEKRAIRERSMQKFLDVVCAGHCVTPVDTGSANKAVEMAHPKAVDSGQGKEIQLLKEDIKHLHDRIDRHKRLTDAQDKYLQDAVDKIDDLSKDVSATRRKVGDLTDDLRRYEGENKRVRNFQAEKLDNVEKRLLMVAADSASTKKAVSEWEKSGRDLPSSGDVRVLESRLAGLERSALEPKANSHETSSSVLEEIGASKSRLDSTEGRLKELRETLFKLETNMNTTRTEVAELKETLSRANPVTVSLGNEDQPLRWDQPQEFHPDSTTPQSGNPVDKLERDVRKHEVWLANLDQRMNETNGFNHARALLGLLAQQIPSLPQLMKELATIRLEHEADKKKVDEHERQLSSVAEDILRVEKSRPALTQLNDTSETTAPFEQLRTGLKTTQDELREVKQKVDSSDFQMTSLETRLAQLQSDYKKVNTTLANAEKPPQSTALSRSPSKNGHSQNGDPGAMKNSRPTTNRRIVRDDSDDEMDVQIEDTIHVDHQPSPRPYIPIVPSTKKDGITKTLFTNGSRKKHRG